MGKYLNKVIVEINIDSDGCLAMTVVIRVKAEKRGEFDPEKYFGSTRDSLNEHITINMKGYKRAACLMWSFIF